MGPLGLELGDDDDRQDHLVLGEPQQGGRVAQQDARVENVRAVVTTGSSHVPLLHGRAPRPEVTRAPRTGTGPEGRVPAPFRATSACGGGPPGRPNGCWAVFAEGT